MIWPKFVNTWPTNPYNIVRHKIPKSWTIIPLYITIRAPSLLERHLECVYGDVCPFSQQSICKFRPAPQSVFQFVSKVFRRVQISNLCRKLELLNGKFVKPRFFFGDEFGHRDTVMLKQKTAFSKICHKVGCAQLFVFAVAWTAPLTGNTYLEWYPHIFGHIILVMIRYE